MKFHTPSLAEILDGRDLTTAEQRLLDCRQTGELAYFGNSVPEGATEDNRIDAAIIRYLLLGGCEEHRPHPKGVELYGAYVSGVLDFEGCQTKLTLFCVNSRFELQPNFMDSGLGQLNLSGCHVPGLNGHRMKVQRDVLLNGKFTSSETVNLSSAFIGGQLSCVKGSFDGNGQTALNCSAMQVGADVFLRGGFKAAGIVNFTRANISGNIECLRAKFDGSFLAVGMRVKHTFAWRDISGRQAVVSLIEAEVGVLVDDVVSWDGVKTLRLKGFKYGALDNQFSDFPFKDRIDWVRASVCDELEQSAYNKATGIIDKHKGRFEPQPYVHLARVFDADGHRMAAARVRERMEWRLRRSEFARVTFAATGGLGDGGRAMAAWLVRIFECPFGWFFGFGHRPMRGLVFALGIILLSIFFYGHVYDKGQFAPNSDIILTSQGWRDFADIGCRPKPFEGCIANPAAVWLQSKAGTDYESFSAIGYGFDLFLPLDALGQEAAWAPSKDRGTLGAWGFYMRWVIQTLGWIFTAVLAAALTGIIGRKEE